MSGIPGSLEVSSRLDRLERANAELAEAILRLSYSKNLHNIGCLEAIAGMYDATFDEEYRKRHE
jgi:hypothetical protein